MPEVTDLMRVAQYVKSDKGAPSDVYNAACRMLDRPAAPDADLRERMAEVLTREHYRRARERIEASPEDHCAAFADVALAVRDEEVERLRAELAGMRDLFEAANTVAGARTDERDALKATVESVRQYAAELRSYNSPAGIAAVYADALDALLPPRVTTETEVPA